MHAHRLSTGISHRGFPGCGVVLDLARDRYWQVDAEASLALDWIAGRRFGAINPGQIGRLEQLGLIERANDVHPRQRDAHLPAPTRSAIETSDGAPACNPLEAIEAAALVITARRDVRRRSLRSNLTDVERWRLARPATQRGNLTALARLFSAYRRLVPLANKCLPDTLAFLRFTGRRGHFPRLVFGVEAWPFAAHCWAQSDEIVLNDALDHARSFSPILVV